MAITLNSADFVHFAIPLAQGQKFKQKQSFGYNVPPAG